MGVGVVEVKETLWLMVTAIGECAVSESYEERLLWCVGGRGGNWGQMCVNPSE